MRNCHTHPTHLKHKATCFRASRTNCLPSFLFYLPSQSRPPLTHSTVTKYFIFHPAGSLALPNPIPLSNSPRPPCPHTAVPLHQAPAHPSLLTLGLAAEPFIPISADLLAGTLQCCYKGKKGYREMEKRKAQKATLTTIDMKEGATYTRTGGNEINKTTGPDSNCWGDVPSRDISISEMKWCKIL